MLWNPTLWGFQAGDHEHLKISENCDLAREIGSERRSHSVDFGRSSKSSPDFSWASARPIGHKTPLSISPVFHTQYWQGSYRQNLIGCGTQTPPKIVSLWRSLPVCKKSAQTGLRATWMVHKPCFVPLHNWIPPLENKLGSLLLDG